MTHRHSKNFIPKLKGKCTICEIGCTFNTGVYVYRLFIGKNESLFFCKFLQDLKTYINDYHSDYFSSLALYLDGCSIHFSKYTTLFNRTTTGFNLIKAIPYSPQSNPQEYSFAYHTLKLAKYRFENSEEFIQLVGKTSPIINN